MRALSTLLFLALGVTADQFVDGGARALNFNEVPTQDWLNPSLAFITEESPCGACVEKLRTNVNDLGNALNPLYNFLSSAEDKLDNLIFLMNKADKSFKIAQKIPKVGSIIKVVKNVNNFIKSMMTKVKQVSARVLPLVDKAHDVTQKLSKALKGMDWFLWGVRTSGIPAHAFVEASESMCPSKVNEFESNQEDLRDALLSMVHADNECGNMCNLFDGLRIPDMGWLDDVRKFIETTLQDILKWVDKILGAATEGACCASPDFVKDTISVIGSLSDTVTCWVPKNGDLGAILLKPILDVILKFTDSTEIVLFEGFDLGSFVIPTAGDLNLDTAFDFLDFDASANLCAMDFNAEISFYNNGWQPPVITYETVDLKLEKISIDLDEMFDDGAGGNIFDQIAQQCSEAANGIVSQKDDCCCVARELSLSDGTFCVNNNADVFFGVQEITTALARSERCNCCENGFKKCSGHGGIYGVCGMSSSCSATKGYGEVCSHKMQCTNGRRCLQWGQAPSDTRCCNQPDPFNYHCKDTLNDGEDCAKPTQCKNSPCWRNVCQKKPNGELCDSKSDCLSGKCPDLRCRECTEDSHCPSDKFCTDFANGWKCESKKSRSQSCSRDRQCASGKCWNAACRDCVSDSHCPGHQYCTDLANGKQCRNKKGRSQSCSRDRQCSSNRCWNAACRDCIDDGHCPGHQFCTDLANGKRCSNKKGRRQSCSRNRQCASNNCNVIFRCGK